MSSPNYIPPREADFVNWVDNFSTLITADPTSYGLSSGDASALAALVATYLGAYSAAVNPSTRGPSTISAKDAARANVTARSRQLAIIIQSNPSVTDEQKTDLGITVRKTNRTPIPAPTTSPLLAFIAATPLQHTLRASDQLTPDSRAKPFGALSLRLRVWVAPIGTSPSGPPTYTLQLTTNPIAIDFDSGDIGKIASYVGNWVTRTGLIGPDSAGLGRVVI